MSEVFRGKSVFITGASSGIGAALAKEFARHGARVALVGRRADRLLEVEQAITSQGGEATSAVCDVADRESLEGAVAKAVEAFDGIEVVVANAGFGVSGPFETLTTEDYRRQFETNFFGVLDTLYATLPYLKASKGQVAIVASVLGRVGYPIVSAYCASKFALCGLAESLYYELAEHGIAVTCINPGLVASDLRLRDNLGRVHPHAKDPAPPWLLMSAEKAAKIIVRAMARGRFEVVVTTHGKAIVSFARHLPRTWRWAVSRFVKGRMSSLEKHARPTHPSL